MVVQFISANLIHSYDWSVKDGAGIDMADTKFTGMGNVYLKNPWTFVTKLRVGAPAF